jgi:hypothetical protein
MSGSDRFLVAGSTLTAALWAVLYVRTGSLAALIAFAAFGAAACAFYIAFARDDDA